MLLKANRFPLHHGGELAPACIAYSVSGKTDHPAVVVLGGISAGRAVLEWWGSFAGKNRVIDTESFCVIGIDFVGGSHTSTGPTGPGFPRISTFDQARAIRAVLDELGIDCLHALIGSSYGGMVALAFASLYPARTAHVIAIGAAHEPHPMATALRSLQRRTIRLGLDHGCSAEAVAIARGIAMTTYRTADEFSERFAASARADGTFAVEEYLEHCGETYARNYSPWGFLCLSESIDLHSVDPSSIRVPCTLVAVTSDALAPVWQIRALAARIAAPVHVVEIDSKFGHDAFLKEIDSINTVLQSVLTEGAYA